MDKKEVVEALYVPMTSIHRAVEFIEGTYHFNSDYCKTNLAILQESRSFKLTEDKDRHWKTKYRMALRRAIYSHKWNDLAYLLKKSPIWEQEAKFEIPIYIRALIILLMNHPTAKSQKLLDEYLHMVLACRSSTDKNALYKGILSLTNKLFTKTRLE